jgi:hypothetical protein
MDYGHFLGLYLDERYDALTICHVDLGVARALGATTSRVMLSYETVMKQRMRHRDLRPDDYRVLRMALLDGEYRRQEANKAVVLYVDALLTDYNVRACVKATRDGSELYLVSFCLMRRKSYQQELRKPLPILRGHQ